MIQCIICTKMGKKEKVIYTYVSIDKLCNICKEKKIEEIIKYEDYKNKYCHGGC